MAPIRDEAREVFCRNPWFAALPLQEQEALLERAEPMHLGRGAVLYRKGQEGAQFWGLLSGVVKISSVGVDGREGILALIEAGNWFNESTLLDGQPHPYDATVVEGDARLLVVGAEGFGQLMLRPVFAAAVARLLAQRLRAVFGLVEDAMLRSMRTRVARRLLALAHGDATMAAQARAHVLVSQDALAMMLGITRQTLSRELQRLVMDGVLVLGYGRIDIVSVPALQRCAEQV